MLIINNLTKKFGDVTVLDDINLEFKNGVYGVLAPNGAGKTTLIKILATLLLPTKGEILFDGEDIYEMDERYREIIGYLPQNFGYYKNYTAKKFLLYIAALKGINGSVAIQRVDEVLKLLALQEIKDKKLKCFSGGMIRKIGIAQALLNDPKILILDEPTVGLDPKERVEFRNLLNDLSNDRIIILSTHIVSDIEFISNEVIMMKDEKILYKDSIQNICNDIDIDVYERYITFEESKEFRKKNLVLSDKQENGMMKIRFIAHKQEEGWMRVAPSLEDIFLFVYR